MKTLIEKQFQNEMYDYLVKENMYKVGENKNYNYLTGIDSKYLFEFLKETQADELLQLQKIYKDDTETVIINTINNDCLKKHSNIIRVIKKGITIANIHLKLMYEMVENSFNQELKKLYSKNILSVTKELNASETERVDLCIFLNGIPIMTFELKCEAAGQSYEHAIYQYRTQRNPSTKLFKFKSGAIVHFAMDTSEVYMTTKIDRENTYFLPFNKGKGEGVNQGAGNDIPLTGYATDYMYKEVLKKDSVIELISKFIFMEEKETITDKGRKKIKETLIFPRFHQREAVCNLIEDVKINKTSQNYLIQHSAGSGKTNSISWLAYRLASLYDENDNIIYDNVIITTDRVIVDRQLQKAIMQMEHKSGFIKVLDDKCTSKDLANALNSNTKITVTTIQKFPYILDEVKNLKDKNFALIIDEAHSSTASKTMQSITQVLACDNSLIVNPEDFIENQLLRIGKQPNVSMFAFTATPKATTLELFGKTNLEGKKEAFHLYSMKQAIEEGFILDVLSNYITYETYYKINKKIQDDPKLNENKAKKGIAKFLELHDTNIAQRIEIIIEHFKSTVEHQLNGSAKAMVVTSSREAAVKYRKAFDEYIRNKGYDMKAVVAFSGKVKLDEDDKEYTEENMNQVKAEKLAQEFDKDDYQVMIVANKYQTGFDQPKLCAMYILKKLSGINAVQTLSRLNRPCKPFNKETVVLDFKNTYEEIENAFSKYYTATILANSISVENIYEIEAKIDNYYIFDDIDINDLADILNKKSITAKEKTKINNIMIKTKNVVDTELDDLNERREFKVTLKKFIRFYQFLIQTSAFCDVNLHKKFQIIELFIDYVNIQAPGSGFDLKNKIQAYNFTQKKKEEITKSNLKPKSEIRLVEADSFTLAEEKIERLSTIINNINSAFGKKYDNDVAVNAMLSIKNIMLKDDDLKISAKNNKEEDFKYNYYDNMDDALVKGYTSNVEFFKILLSNEDIKKEILDIFQSEIYNSLKNS